MIVAMFLPAQNRNRDAAVNRKTSRQDSPSIILDVSLRHRRVEVLGKML